MHIILNKENSSGFWFKVEGRALGILYSSMLMILHPFDHFSSCLNNNE